MAPEKNTSETEIAVLTAIIGRMDMSFSEVNKYLLDPKDGLIVAYVNLENRVKSLERWVKITGTLLVIVFSALIGWLFGWLPKPEVTP